MTQGVARRKSGWFGLGQQRLKGRQNAYFKLKKNDDLLSKKIKLLRPDKRSLNKQLRFFKIHNLC